MLMRVEPVIATETAMVSGTATRASASGGSVDAENAINLAYRPGMPITRQTWVAGKGIRITSVSNIRLRKTSEVQVLSLIHI